MGGWGADNESPAVGGEGQTMRALLPSDNESPAVWGGALADNESPAVCGGADNESPAVCGGGSIGRQ